MHSSIGIFKGDRTHSPSLVGGALDHVREDTAVGEDLRECSRGEGDECGKCEHLWSFGSGRRVVPVKMSARESADRLGHPVGVYMSSIRRPVPVFTCACRPVSEPECMCETRYAVNTSPAGYEAVQ